MTPSNHCIVLIKHFEGFSAVVYKDASNHATIGYGHVLLGDEPVPRKISQEQADHLLRNDVEAVARLVALAVECPLTQNQFDALVSLAFNIGTSAFLKSTLARKLNLGDDLESCASEFLRWNKATVGGKKVVLPGLQQRRAAERALFLGDSP